MNIVVTGATSFLGRALVNRLLEEGNRVFAVIRPASLHADCLDRSKKGLTVIEKGLDELDQISKSLAEPCEVFYHFGWDGSGSAGRMNQKVQQENVKNGLKALEGAKSLGCRRFLMSGSQAEYGIHKEAMTEEAVCLPISEYGKAKLEFCQKAMQQTMEWKKKGIWDMEYIHTRIFSVYGPQDHPWSLVESCLRAFKAGEYISLGECTQMWNFLYVDDCIRALELLMNQKEGSVSGIYNVAGPKEATRPLREYIRLLYEACGCHGSYSYGRRPPNAEGPANLIPDITRLEAATGWKPETGFLEGVDRTIAAEKY